ncbi:regucalcin-like isoform X2 [Chelonus insularis]|uniref:regucalcin-like isoform X2 n=1 Tax=Chelonus insularis TaxID=460826 RepID=UPI001588B5B8|nr:regucalcin-like isoform X2 [Chelonus insularis]
MNMHKIILLTAVCISLINFIQGGDNTEISIVPILGPFDLAEGPHWDENSNILYFVDIHQQKLYSWDSETNELTYTFIMSVAVPIDGKENSYVVGSGTNLVEIYWNRHFNDTDPDVEIIRTVDSTRLYNRFNDGKVDPKGRFWAGTMAEHGNEYPPNQASLYKFDSDAKRSTMISPVSISNGLVWNHANDTFYYIDSPQKKVFVFDYDNESGNISNQRTLFDFVKYNITGVPDGMTIDSTGNLWVADNLGNGKVLQIDPSSGELLRIVDMPVTHVSSLAFGGPNKDILYVTSAREGLEDEIKNQPYAGFVFAIYGLGVTGSPMLSYKLEDDIVFNK